jgi:hypothetical protein
MELQPLPSRTAQYFSIAAGPVSKRSGSKPFHANAHESFASSDTTPWSQSDSTGGPVASDGRFRVI